MPSDAKMRKVKKVSPYPIEGEMVHGGTKVGLSILRIGVRGLVANVKSGICHVGVNYQCQFSLPTSSFAVHTEGQVFKTHDGINPKTGAVGRTVEVLFKNLPDGERSKIKTFLAKIGQKE